ncbi:DEAD/DEAH box helicase [Ilumatobacter sp.]|uniref:DEAD/DEAH box helicase n=1 Tax=Ilumatobacter sp. TaxID=1967498 RepID=UPI0037524D7B
MPNLVDVEYERTGASTSVNALGMREMQERAYEARNSQYLLLKAPPASGKSRALMFLALDKIYNQGLKKVIVAVPERSIGSSFASTNLVDRGFFANWEIRDENNLCTPGGDASKVAAVRRFLEGPDALLVCTHATLRFAHEAVDEALFDDTLLAIDEFHHVSADPNSRLGAVLRSVMSNTSAHVIAMTGSYFRGDAIPVLEAADEAKFTKVTYNYYQQLNGYTYMKSLGIGYHFYQGRYTDTVHEVLDTDRKTILHIPSVQSGESTKDKHREVDGILDAIGTVVNQDDETGVILVERASDGRMIKVADLVQDEAAQRSKIVEYLRTMEAEDDIDLIIALGMAKEGFDWTWCEHALTVGYRGSLTEIIQIIGRCTRDSPNKTHAQFTNLIAQPAADDEEVKVAVNNMLKAITASLLMEQVVAPNFKFKTKRAAGEQPKPGEMHIAGFKEPSTQRVREIVDGDLNDLKAQILQDPSMLKAMPGNVDPEVMNKVLIPKIIRTRYPDMTEAEVEEVRQHVVVDSVIKNGEIKDVDGKKFVLMANRFVNINELNLDLIDQVNPFQKAFEILSKSVTKQVLKMIQDAIDETRLEISEEEALLVWPKVQAFVRERGQKPDVRSPDPLERRLAEALLFIQKRKRELGV